MDQTVDRTVEQRGGLKTFMERVLALEDPAPHLQDSNYPSTREEKTHHDSFIALVSQGGGFSSRDDRFRGESRRASQTKKRGGDGYETSAMKHSLSKGTNVQAYSRREELLRSAIHESLSSTEGVYSYDRGNHGGHSLEDVLLMEEWNSSMKKNATLVEQIIDESLLIELHQDENFAPQYRAIIRAATHLINDLGIENVVRLQVFPWTRVDESKKLRGYLLHVYDSASVRPILETMPNFGAGRAVKTNMYTSSNAIDEAIRSLFSGTALRDPNVYDFSAGKSDMDRREMHEFLQAVKTSNPRFDFIPTMAKLDDARKQEIVAQRDNLAKLQSISKFVSLGKHESDIGLYQHSQPTHRVKSYDGVIDTYSQAVVDMISAWIAEEKDVTIQKFERSPFFNMAKEHGRILRAALMHELEDVMNDNRHESVKMADISYTKDNFGAIQDPWKIQVPVTDVDADHCYHNFHPCTPRELQSLMDMSAVHIRKQNPSKSRIFVISNEMYDLTATENRTNFAVDRGHSVGYSFLSYHGVSTTRPMFPASPMNLTPKRKFKEAISDMTIRHMKRVVKYEDIVDELDLLPLNVSPFQTIREMNNMFNVREIANRAKDALMIMKHAVQRFVSLNDIEEDRMFTVVRWISSIDQSRFSLESRYRIGGSAPIVINGTHSERVSEVLELIARKIGKMNESSVDNLGSDLLNVFVKGTEKHNPGGVNIEISQRLANFLLSSEENEH